MNFTVPGSVAVSGVGLSSATGFCWIILAPGQIPVYARIPNIVIRTIIVETITAVTILLILSK
jgi:hypothetical protein